ncbi:hypothetical protein NESM_000669600 [Novymonas esmeraldas]|uniref:Calponin-homology (CH) domain-containing protein n=1 Tax=Novymonas esmeraldas TaxID=1808958 RepID=A0AAW0EUG2_9TRYP
MGDIYAVAEDLVQELRVSLCEWGRTPDTLACVQRTATRKAEAEARGDASGCRVSPTAGPRWPAFAFTPLTTAPVTSAHFSSVEHRHPDTAATVGGATLVHQRRRSGEGRVLRSRPVAHVDANKVVTATEGSAAAALHSSVEGAAPTSTGCARASTSAKSHLSPLGRRLYADMQRRGSALLAAAHPTAVEWRRRSAGPQDAEVRRAVRDYLYRMNIISAMEVAEDATGAAPAPCALGDAVLNGAALCQLVATLLAEGGSGGGGGGGGAQASDPVPCRTPRTLDEVRVNYASALAALRDGAAETARERIPREAWTVTPEEVFRRASPAALLSLFVHLISAYLPAPEELPRWRPHLCWQPAADADAYAPLPALQLATAEAECGAFLHACGVLPDPAVHHLPGDECLLPAVTAAPFMAKWTGCVRRSDAPPSLCVPSVWPFLCNGVLLALLVRRCNRAEATSQEAAAPLFFANPRTTACCAANVAGALRAIHAAWATKLPSSVTSAESVAAVLRGHRMHLLRLLCDVRAAVDAGAPERGMSSASATHAGTAAGDCRTPSNRASLSSEAGAGAAKLTRSASSTQTASTAARGALPLSASPSPSSSRRPASPPLSAAHRSPAAPRRGAEPPVVRPPLGGGGLQCWLQHQLGTEYRHVAADGSFTVDLTTFAQQRPCLIFSDGVVLACLIARLERRRCGFLDCVQPAAKRAARLFNVRRCLEFLRHHAGVLFDLPLLDEALVEGRVDGVMAVLHGMRRHYGAAHTRPQQ